MDQRFHQFGITAGAIDGLFDGDHLRVDGGRWRPRDKLSGGELLELGYDLRAGVTGAWGQYLVRSPGNEVAAASADAAGEPLLALQGVGPADPETGELGKASARVHYDEQRMAFDLIIRGYGAIGGRVLVNCGNSVCQPAGAAYTRRVDTVADARLPKRG